MFQYQHIYRVFIKKCTYARGKPQLTLTPHTVVGNTHTHTHTNTHTHTHIHTNIWQVVVAPPESPTQLCTVYGARDDIKGKVTITVKEVCITQHYIYIYIYIYI